MSTSREVAAKFILSSLYRPQDAHKPSARAHHALALDAEGRSALQSVDDVRTTETPLDVGNSAVQTITGHQGRDIVGKQCKIYW